MNAPDAALLGRHLADAARRAGWGKVSFTRFLDPAQEQLCATAASREGVHAAFWGGYPDAERRVCAFYADQAPDQEEYPVDCLALTWNKKYADAAHRDILGAVMGLGLDREMLGDVAMTQDGAALFLHPDISSYVQTNLQSAGRATIHAAPQQGAPDILPPVGTQMRITVSSPRLDAVLAAGYRLSRSEAQEMIEGGLVKKNHIVCLRGDAHLKQGDLLSCRGLGRLRLLAEEGETRKGRLALTLFRYGT